MTRSIFNQLRYEDQLAAVSEQGHFLARRWASPDRISLYHLGSFFVELYYDTHANRIACVRNFRNTVPLEIYVAWLPLSKLL
jgi:hypothetical protein